MLQNTTLHHLPAAEYCCYPFSADFIPTVSCVIAVVNMYAAYDFFSSNRYNLNSVSYILSEILMLKKGDKKVCYLSTVDSLKWTLSRTSVLSGQICWSWQTFPLFQSDFLCVKRTSVLCGQQTLSLKIWSGSLP